MGDWLGRRTGGQDWLAIWRAMYDAERAQGDAATDPALERGGDQWAGRTRRFVAASHPAEQVDAFLARVLAEVEPGDCVIDVGAGAGRYLPALARRAARVIAVEPSPAMGAEVERLIAARGLGNVELIRSSWPLAEPISADVVISAHVLYGVREVGPFLQAIDQAARRACYVHLGLEHPAAVLGPFWEHVHGQTRLPLPAASEALCCLFQLGIPAALDLIAARGSFSFGSLDEATAEICARLRLAPSPANLQVVRSVAASVLRPAADGSLAPPGQPPYAALLHWRPTRRASALL